MRLPVLASGLLVLSGCSFFHGTEVQSSATDPTTAMTTGDAKQYGPPQPFDEAFIRVKQEIQLFLEDNNSVNEKWPRLLSDLNAGTPLRPVCGTGKIDFQITSVDMEFDTISDVNGGGNASLKIPVFPAADAASIGPSIKATYDRSSTRTITYSYRPAPNDFYRGEFKKGHKDDIPEAIRKQAVIVPALDAIRDGLTRATTHYPCFQNLSDDDPAQKLSFKVALVRDVTGNLNFNFLVLSAGANIESKKTGENTIVVNYRPINPGLSGEDALRKNSSKKKKK